MWGENNFRLKGRTQVRVEQGKIYRMEKIGDDLGGWMVQHRRNDTDTHICPLCNEQDSWERIVANVPKRNC